MTDKKGMESMYIVIIASIVILATTAIIWLEALKESKIPIGVFEWVMATMSIIIIITAIVKGV